MVSRLHSGFTFEMLSKLPSNSFRVHKVTHRPHEEGAAASGQTRRVDISSPANWYMLGGDVSRVCWSAKVEAAPYTALVVAGAGPADHGYDPQRVASDRHAVRWGAGACWGSVRETLNSGGLEVSAVTDRNAVRGVWMARGLSSKRVSELSSGGLSLVAKGLANTNALAAVILRGLRTKQGPNFDQQFQIPTLISSGCSDQFARSQAAIVNFAGPFANQYHGYSYSCPISTFSRIASNPVVPVGFLGAYNPSNGFSLEFRVADVLDATRTADTQAAPTGLSISELRVEATYIEILDEAVQRSVEGLFNKVNSIDVEGQTLTARLEMPVISYAPSSYVLGPQTSSAILRIPCNSPSLRGLMLVVRPTGSNFGPATSPRWRQIRVQVGGLCIQESPARERVGTDPAPAPTPGGADTLGSWMATESYRAAHLFSYYPPDEEAVKPDLAMARFLYEKPGRIQGAHAVNTGTIVAPSEYDHPNIIHMSFENAPHYSTDGTELNMAKGVDLRNIGEVRLELEYTDFTAANGVVLPLTEAFDVDVILAHDEVYAVDRSGATNITQFVL